MSERLTCWTCGGPLRNPCPWDVVCDACFDARFAAGYRKTPQFKQRRGGGPRLIERGRRPKVNTGIPGDWRGPPLIGVRWDEHFDDRWDAIWAALAGPEKERKATIAVPQFWRRYSRLLVATRPWLRLASPGERRFCSALFQIRYSGRELLKALPQLPHPSKGIIDELPGGWDLDGGVISADELLISESARNHGRARRWVAKIDKYGQTDLERSRVSGRSGRSHDGSLNFKHQIEVDFLDGAGWHIRKAGATGTPRGRQPKGIRDEDELIDAINAGLWGDPERIERVKALYEKDGRSALRQLRAELVDGVPAADKNTQAVADLFRITRRAARNL